MIYLKDYGGAPTLGLDAGVEDAKGKAGELSCLALCLLCRMKLRVLCMHFE